MASRYDDELWELIPAERPPPADHLRRFVRELGFARQALDLGCGDGRLAGEVRTDHLTVADVSGVALARARRQLAGRPFDAVELDPDEPLPFRDSTYDLVLCAETIEHVRDVQLLLSEIRRVLRPQGRLGLTTPAHGRGTAIAALVRGFDRCFDPVSPHLRFFTRGSLRRLLGEMGFHPDGIRREHSSLLAVAHR